jgi:chromosome segregation ATPase
MHCCYAESRKSHGSRQAAANYRLAACAPQSQKRPSAQRVLVTLPVHQESPANLETAPINQFQTRLDALKRRLIENESQRIEIAGQLNHLSIQLHRGQLRLQMLSERKAELEKELAALQQAGSQN